MNYSEELLSQFDRYTSEDMLEEERQAFEISLQNDQSLQEAFDDYLHLKRGMLEFGYSQASEQIAGWESEMVNEKEAKVVSFKRWYLVAATISMVLIATISWWKLSSPESSDELYAAYYEPYPDVITSRGNGENLLNEGLFNYESGSFEEAAGYLKNYLVANNENKEVLFYLGQSYLGNNELEEALNVFKNLRQQKGFKLREANEWYLALTLLKLKDIESAKDVLKHIMMDTNHAYREKSQSIIEKL